MRRDLFLGLRTLLAARRIVEARAERARRLSARAISASVADLLPEQWRSAEYVRTPPVRLFEGAAEPPTAMSWLRRRAGLASASASASGSAATLAPPPASALYRLFRERQVRLARLVDVEDEGEADGGEGGRAKVRVTRITSPSRRLDEGDVLLAPRAAFGVAAEPPPSQPQLATTTSVRPSDVRAWIVAKHPDFFVLNKPAGVKVHGLEPGPRGGEPATLDLRTGVLRRALGVRSSGSSDDDDNDGPRPVHRLDQRVSGCLVVARDRDAAAWLGRAFESSSSTAERATPAPSSSSLSSASSAPPPPPPLRVEKTYLALVERLAAGEEAEWLSPRKTGTLRTRGLIDGRVRSSITKYRVLAVGAGGQGKGNKGQGAAAAAASAGTTAALLELSPVTGTKHQLRRHCALRLGAPIVGDWRYGWRDGGGGSASAAAGGWVSDGDDGEGEGEGEGREGAPPPPPLLLHSRSLVVYRPGGPPLRAVAPLPSYWRAALRARGIEPPRG